MGFFSVFYFFFFFSFNLHPLFRGFQVSGQSLRLYLLSVIGGKGRREERKKNASATARPPLTPHSGPTYTNKPKKKNRINANPVGTTEPANRTAVV